MSPVSNFVQGRFIRAPRCKALWEEGTQVNTTQNLILRTLKFLGKRIAITFKSYFDLFTDTSKLLVASFAHVYQKESLRRK